VPASFSSAPSATLNSAGDIPLHPTTRQFLTLPAAIFLLTTLAHAQLTVRRVVDFDHGWRFQQSDATDAQQPAFDDAHWQSLSVPHDWSIAGPIAQSNPSGQGGGFFPTGVAWYRKDFSLAPADAHKHAYIVFDGVMANSDVWINGFHLGKRPNGTVSFFYDLTGHLNSAPGSRNILAVRCDTSQQPASRWYEGNGIYRKVRLVLLNDVHLAPWSSFVTTPVATADSATISVRSTVVNDSDTPATVALNLGLQLPDGTSIHTPIVSKPTTVAPHASADIALAFNLPHPKLWDIDAPNLHILHVTLTSQNAATDDDIVPFGIREFHFDAETGFWLNGRNFKLKGAALHIDGGAVGDAVPLAVYERRLLALRALGMNAIRTAHNPPSPGFLDLCDRLGFLVMDEMFDCWTVGKNPYDYHLYFREWALRDLHDTVLRDRNHPSIILWSAGNEIHDTPHPEVAIPILKSLVAAFHAADPTRPVTQGLFRPNASHDYDDGLADLLDVVGQNYREQELLAAHAQKPTRKILGTENTHDRNQWLAMRDHPAYSGQFLWIGIDYLGEAGELGGWPLFANGDGLLDRTLVPRARAYERESWWLPTPNIHIARRIGTNDKTAVDPGYENLPKSHQVLFLDWSPADRNPHTESVEVYTNAEEADLLLNGKSLGRQKLHPDASPLTWKVPFEPGTLTAVAYTASKEVARNELRTPGQALAVRLIPDNPTFAAGPDGVLTLRAEVIDANGVIVPDAGNLLKFSVTGARILAVDSGSNTDRDPFQSDTRHAFQGRAIVLIEAAHAGTVTVSATAEGLKPATVTVQSQAANAAIARSF
jgi:beta-galactosidase